MTTVYQRFRSLRKPIRREALTFVGEAAIEVYKKRYDGQLPPKVKQREGINTFNVYGYPDDFVRVLDAIIHQYYKDNPPPPESFDRRPSFRPRYGDSRGGGYNRGGGGGYNRDRRDGGGYNRGGGGYRDQRDGGGGYNRDRREGGGYNRDGGGYNRDRREGGGYNRDSGGYNRDRREGGGYNRDGGGYNRDRREGGGYNRDRREGGYNRDGGGGGYNRDHRGGDGYNRGGGGYNRGGGGYRDHRDGGGYNRDDRNYNRNEYQERRRFPEGENQPSGEEQDGGRRRRKRAVKVERIDRPSRDKENDAIGDEELLAKKQALQNEEVADANPDEQASPETKTETED